MTREHLAAAWRRGQHGWPAAYPVAQFPNLPLLVWIAASALQRVLDGNAAEIALVAGTMGLATWALLELVAGDNAFRRAIGAVAVIMIALRVAG